MSPGEIKEWVSVTMTIREQRLLAGRGWPSFETSCWDISQIWAYAARVGGGGDYVRKGGFVYRAAGERDGAKWETIRKYAVAGGVESFLSAYWGGVPIADILV